MNSADRVRRVSTELIIAVNTPKASGWASGEIQKASTSLFSAIMNSAETLRTRSAEFIIAVDRPKVAGLSPVLF